MKARNRERCKPLKVFVVVHHEGDSENRTFVIAESRWEASKLVSGEVMHVSDGFNVEPGVSFGTSGWNKRFRSPDYYEPSESWRAYLKERHLNTGHEDVAQ